MGETIF